MIQHAATKYFIYARKSSESDEKQVQSIEDQILVLETFRKAANLTLVDVLFEARSAKEPNSRPIFENLIRRIKAGEANGIIVWKIDRLSRNPIDGALIQWLLQKSTITSIRTPDREYRPEDNVLILSVESSMATQYVLDLSKNVKRGLKSKIDKGWRPGVAPLGYLNTLTEIRGENYIVKDPKRFDIIRKAWDLILTGNYLPTQILNILNNDWGLRTRQWKKVGGKPLSRASIYRLFTNIFYAGLIKYNGIYKQGSHDSMISVDEFDKVQFLLGRKGKRRPNRHEYAYTGCIKCGDCNGTISATYKEKFIRRSRTIKTYSLYYCFCARKNLNNCRQLRYTNSKVLDNAIEEILVSFTVDHKIQAWIFERLDELKEVEDKTENRIANQQHDTIQQSYRQLENLTHLRLREMIEDKEFVQERNRLKNEITILESKQRDEQNKNENFIETTREAFHFVFFALHRFQSGSLQDKREILNTISGLNCTLKDKRLNIYKAEWLISIEKYIKSLDSNTYMFEPENNYTTQRQKAYFDTACLTLRGLVDDVGAKLSTSDKILELITRKRNDTPP